MIFLNSDTLYSVVGLKDQTTGLFVNDATVGGTLLDLAGVTLGTFAFDYLADSNGVYQGVLDQATVNANCVEGVEYLVSVVATMGEAVTDWKQTEEAGYCGFGG